MSIAILLAVGKLEADWRRHHSYSDHLELYQSNDLTELIRPVYDDYSEDGDRPTFELRRCFRKPLRHVASRLHLLGITLESCQNEFEELVSMIGGLADSESNLFAELFEKLRQVDVLHVSDQYQNDFDLGEFFAEEIAPRLKCSGQSHLRGSGEIFENLSAHAVLWMLAQNVTNLDLPVICDLDESDFPDDTLQSSSDSTVSRSQRFLIVTEGSSDAYVLKKSLFLRRHEISDFFYFVDVDAGFPFGGTGNLHRFCEGLARINLLNNTVIIYGPIWVSSGFSRSRRASEGVDAG